jgi:hypothetical protein
MKPNGEKNETYIGYDMLISNNKQFKYREAGTGWECGILPRDNLSHCIAVLLKPTLLKPDAISGQDISDQPYHTEQPHFVLL